MGKNFIDLWTLFHCICGFLSTYTLIPSNIVVSAFVTNILHLIMETLENSKNKETDEILETRINHIGDIMAFLLGSIIANVLVLKYELVIQSKIVRYSILFILLLIFIQEICRELLPKTWPFDSAYKPLSW